MVHREAQKVINDIYDDNRDRVQDMIENNMEIISPYKQRRYRELETDPDHPKEVKQKIRLKLYDMKEVIEPLLKSRKQIES